MVKKSVYSALLIGVLLLCMSPAPAYVQLAVSPGSHSVGAGAVVVVNDRLS